MQSPGTGRRAGRAEPAPTPAVAGRAGTPAGGAAGDRAGRLVAALAVVTSMCTYALVALGSTVRVTESGMGCPSWPLCYGRVGPVDRYHALLEQSHRYLVALVTLEVAATAVAAARSRRRRAALVPALAGCALVVVQAALGALTVLAHNAPWTVSVHLCVGLVFFASTVVTAVAAVRAPFVRWSARSVGRLGAAAVAAVLAVVVAGSTVVGSGAAGSCPSWPLCRPGAPALLVAWQLVHRGTVGVASVTLLAFVTARWRSTARWPRWRAGSLALLALLAATAALGAASALSRAAAVWQDAHLALAALLFGLVVALVTALATRGEPVVPGPVSPDPPAPDRVSSCRVSPDRVSPDRVSPDRVSPEPNGRYPGLVT